MGLPAIMLLARAVPPSDPTRDDAMRKYSSFGALDRICIAETFTVKAKAYTKMEQADRS